MKKTMLLLLVLSFAGFWMPPTDASSHREAPLISGDPRADNTDVYAFVSPDQPDTVTIIANYIPLEEPAGGPNFHSFDDNVLYEIHVDNDGDAKDDSPTSSASGRRSAIRIPSSITPGRSTASRIPTGTCRRPTASAQLHGRRAGLLGRNLRDAAGQHRTPLDAELRRAARVGGPLAAERHQGVRRTG